MQAFLKALSPRAEFLIVTVGAFGYAMLGSVLSVLAPSASPPITAASLQGLIVYEMLTFAAIAAFLHVRGVTLASLGFKVNALDTLTGFGLAFAAYFSFALVWLLMRDIGLSMEPSSALVSHDLTPASILAASIVNPIFEEVFVCGYVISALAKRKDSWTAINISAAIRLLYHLYQGAPAAGIIPIGLIFAYWYARTGRLWPVIVAHGLWDFISLSIYASQ